MAAIHFFLLLLLLLSFTPYLAVSSNLTLLTTPITFLTPICFSSHFSFSLSPNSSVSLLLLHPPNYFSIDFNSSSITIGNTSRHIIIPTNYLQNLHAFVDYDSAFSQLEVFLTGLGKPKPYLPWLVFPVNFFQMWGDEEVLLVSVSTSTGNNSLAGIPSVPVDPRVYELKKKGRGENTVLQKQEVSVDIENPNLGKEGSTSNVLYSWHFKSWSVAKGSKPVDPSVYENDNRYRSRHVYLVLVLGVIIMAAFAFVVFIVVMVLEATDSDKALVTEYTRKR